MSDLDMMWVHTVTVETFTGTSGYGADTFAAGVQVTGFLDGARKLVRAATGEQIISESTFYTDPSNAARFTPDSRVTASGVVSRVIKANLNDSGALLLPDHLAVTLT